MKNLPLSNDDNDNDNKWQLVSDKGREQLDKDKINNQNQKPIFIFLEIR